MDRLGGVERCPKRGGVGVTDASQKWWSVAEEEGEGGAKLPVGSVSVGDGGGMFRVGVPAQGAYPMLSQELRPVSKRMGN